MPRRLCEWSCPCPYSIAHEYEHTEQITTYMLVDYVVNRSCIIELLLYLHRYAVCMLCKSRIQAGSSIKPKIPSDSNVHAVFESYIT